MYERKLYKQYVTSAFGTISLDEHQQFSLKENEKCMYVYLSEENSMMLTSYFFL